MADKALATVEELPNEILLRCLSFLSANELLICQSVSRGLREVAQDRTLWRELLDVFLRSSPYICVNDDDEFHPADGDTWQSTYFRLLRLVHMKGRMAFSRPREDHHHQHELHRSKTSTIVLPSCPFCGVVMSQVDNGPTESAGGRKRLIYCQGCRIYVWINSCDHCGQAARHLMKCDCCTSDVCPRCYGFCGKRCELCNTGGCRQCVKTKATFADTHSRKSCASQKRKPSRAKRRGGMQDQQPKVVEVLHLCVYCGVTCVACGRIFESEDADFCVACEAAVCYSCDCPCGALDMFQEIRV